MQPPVSTLFVGIGGYGDLYPRLCEKYPEIARLCRPIGVVDPYAKQAPPLRLVSKNGRAFLPYRYRGRPVIV